MASAWPSRFRFPWCIALVVGVVLSYVQQPRGNLLLLALGVTCALLAVILDGKAYGNLPVSRRTISRKSVITCVVSGVLMGLWAPFLTHSMTRGNALGPYSAVVFLTLGALLSCFIWNVYFMKRPLVGEPVSFSGFFRGPTSGHVLGLLGGCIWGTGTVFNMVLRATRAWRSPMPSANPLPWWLLFGESWRGKNLMAQDRVPRCTWR